MAFGDRYSAQDFTTLVANGNTELGDIWSNGTTMWAADRFDSMLYAYNLITKRPDPSKNINLTTADILDLSSINKVLPRGIWSDGTTIWVVSASLVVARDPDAANRAIRRQKIFAYTLSTGARDQLKDFDTLHAAGNRNAAGIWSDGTTMYVVDFDENKIFAYNLQSTARDINKDINLIAESNSSLYGFWGDGETIWLSGLVANKIVAYNISRKARDESNDFNTGSGRDAHSAHGIWANSSKRTVWISGGGRDVIYAYDFVNAPTSHGERIGANGITINYTGNQVNNSDPIIRYFGVTDTEVIFTDHVYNGYIIGSLSTRAFVGYRRRRTQQEIIDGTNQVGSDATGGIVYIGSNNILIVYSGRFGIRGQKVDGSRNSSIDISGTANRPASASCLDGNNLYVARDISGSPIIEVRDVRNGNRISHLEFNQADLGRDITIGNITGIAVIGNAITFFDETNGNGKCYNKLTKSRIPVADMSVGYRPDTVSGGCFLSQRSGENVIYTLRSSTHNSSDGTGTVVLYAFDYSPSNVVLNSVFTYQSLPFSRVAINNRDFQGGSVSATGSIGQDTNQNILAIIRGDFANLFSSFIYLKQSAIGTRSNVSRIKVREINQTLDQAAQFTRLSSRNNITYNNEVYNAFRGPGNFNLPASSVCPIVDRNDNPLNIFDDYAFDASGGSTTPGSGGSTTPGDSNIRKSTDLRKRLCGSRVISKYYLGTRLVWEQSNPPTITTFTATPNTLDLDTATGNVTLRVVGTNFTEGKFINKNTGEVVVSFSTTTGSSSVSTPIPNETTTYTVILTNATGAVSRDVTVTATKNPTIESFQSDGQLASRLPSGGTFRFSAIIDGLPRPTVSADQGIGTITSRHLTRRSDGKWDLTFTHYFGVSGSRQITLTATNSSGSVTAQTTVVVP